MVCLPVLAQTSRNPKLESLLAAAHEAQARGDFRAAAGAYKQAVAITPGVAELWSNLGLMQYESHEYLQSEQAFQHALGINKALFVPNLFIGLDLLELKRTREAVTFLLAAEKLNPNDTQVLLALGRAYHASFDPARAREWYQRATDAAPRNVDAWFGLGVAYLDLAQSASAKVHGDSAPSAEVTELKALGVAALERVDEIEPDSPRMHAVVGDVYQRRRMFREAEEEYSKMLALKPDSIAGLAGLAAAYLYDGHLDEANATARKALAQDPEDTRYLDLP